jgi:putative peptidoglycan binding protein
MKTKFYALLASAALIAQAQAGGHHGGGGGHSATSAAPPVRGSGVSSFHPTPGRNFGGRMIYSGRRFSPSGMGQFNRGSIHRDGGVARFGNNPSLAEGRNNSGRHNGTIANRQNGGGQFRNENNLPPNWQNHVVARHSGNWHHDWDRGRDHRWHGHHCRFVNGSWVIFDLGFYPWWSYGGYPYDYYGYDYYPYGYDPGYYDSGVYEGDDYYGPNDYGNQGVDSTVSAVQERLARQGYYRGNIDGVYGPQTRRAIARYQNTHGQRATGELTANTLQALGLRRVASY